MATRKKHTTKDTTKIEEARENNLLLSLPSGYYFQFGEEQPKRGGVADVYFGRYEKKEALARGLGIPAVLRTPHPEVLPYTHHIFERGGKFLKGISHASNFVQLFEQEQDGEGRVYQILRREECSLEEALPTIFEQPFSYSQRVRLMAGVLNGLKTLHAYGRICMDLRKDNILVRKNRNGYIPKLTDPDLWVTPEELAHDTAAFHAAENMPETRREIWQLRGGCEFRGMRIWENTAPPEAIWHDDYGIASDIFAAGLLFYELITGENAGVITDNPMRMGHFKDVEKLLEHAQYETVARATDYNQKRRFPTAQAMLDKILQQEFVAGTQSNIYKELSA